MECAACQRSLAGVAPIMTDKRSRRFCSAPCCDQLNTVNNNDNHIDNNNEAKPVPPPARHRTDDERKPNDTSASVVSAKMNQVCLKFFFFFVYAFINLKKKKTLDSRATKAKSAQRHRTRAQRQCHVITAAVTTTVAR